MIPHFQSLLRALSVKTYIHCRPFSLALYDSHNFCLYKATLHDVYQNGLQYILKLKTAKFQGVESMLMIGLGQYPSIHPLFRLGIKGLSLWAANTFDSWMLICQVRMRVEAAVAGDGSQ